MSLIDRQANERNQRWAEWEMACLAMQMRMKTGPSPSNNRGLLDLEGHAIRPESDPALA